MDTATLIGLGGIGGTILGGLCSSYATVRFMQGKPKILLTSVSIALINKEKEAYHTVSTDVLRTPSDVYHSLSNCRLIKSPSRFYQNHRDYVEYLIETSKRLKQESLLRKDIRQTLPELKSLLYSGMIDEFYTLWHRLHSTFWSQILNEMIDNDCKMLELEDIDDDTDKKHYQDITDRGPVVAVGSRRLAFNWSRHKELQKKLEEKCHLIALSFSTTHTDNLKAITSYIESIDWSDSEIDLILDLVDKEIERFKDLIVTATITNSGKTAISLKGLAKLHLKSEGYESINEIDGRKFSNRIDKNLTISASMFDIETEKVTDTLILSPGESKSVHLISSEFMCQIEDSAIIQELYGQERECWLEIERLDYFELVNSNTMRFSKTDNK
ncbi:hypothetical protein [Vibrio sp. FF145]|uniref:hypothetical protein n=1 Tax=Vibrio sp. FF145 TaxID=3230013 RepID=UPI00352C9C6E